MKILKYKGKYYNTSLQLWQIINSQYVYRVGHSYLHIDIDLQRPGSSS